MIVRRATPDDLDGICAVAEAVKFDPEREQIGGFLVYMHGRQGYADRLAATDLFDVAVEDGEVVGFLVCYEDHTVEDLVDRGIVGADVLRAKDAAGCKGRWIYGDQIAVHPEHGSRGVAIHLVWDLYQKVRQRGIDVVFVAILHEPLNLRSKALAESMGFVLRGTRRYEDGCLWGLYGREVPCEVPADQAPRVAAHGLTEA
jgi:GNAT superfamily N-acetyltransferase